MNRPRKDFIDRWRRLLAGIALYGSVSEIKDGPLVRAGKILDIPDEVEKLLGQMWDDDAGLKPPSTLPPAQGEGEPPPAGGKKHGEGQGTGNGDGRANTTGSGQGAKSDERRR